jgi:fumarylacetoacetase
VPLADVTLALPWEVADYVDFYSSQAHARNVGAIFRPDSPTCHANWKHLPIGYHGRAGTVVVSAPRWCGPAASASRRRRRRRRTAPAGRLDIEAEVGFVVGVRSEQGSRVPAGALADHVFGVVLLNDWSARDIQAWEYVPLGPFLGKSFATSVSAWVTPLAALAAARHRAAEQDPPPLDYLADADPWALDLELEVELDGEVVSRPPFAGHVLDARPAARAPHGRTGRRCVPETSSPPGPSAARSAASAGRSSSSPGAAASRSISRVGAR